MTPSPPAAPPPFDPRLGLAEAVGLALLTLGWTVLVWFGPLFWES